MELRQLRYAVALGETLNFRQAAQREFITPSALSQQIARLEAELGLKLFERSSHHVELTAAGQIVIAGGADILSRTQRLSDELAAHRAGRKTVLRVGVYAEAAAELTPRILTAAQRELSDALIEIRELNAENRIQAVLDGDVDVVLTTLPVNHDEILREPLFVQPRYALVPDEHPLAQRSVLSVAELDGEPMVLSPDGRGGWGALWEGEDGRSLVGEPVGSCRTVVEAQAAVALRGAILTVPASTVRFSPHPGITAVPMPDAPPCVLSIVTRKHNRAPDVDVFCDVARQVAAEQLECVPDAWLPDAESLA